MTLLAQNALDMTMDHGLRNSGLEPSFLHHYLSCLSRPGVLDVQPLLDGDLPDRGLARQRMEDGQEVRHRPHLVVLRLHPLRITLRAQRLRRLQPARVRQRLLNFKEVPCEGNGFFGRQE